MSIYLGDKLIGGTSHDTVSNAHSLLDYKWTDHILNEMSWLRADTWSWQSGKLYKAAYNHLLADISNAQLKTENINGITIVYYLAPDKHKICPVSEIKKIPQVYTDIGIGWFYIIDQENQRFKLPRSMHGEIVERYQNGPTWYRLYADGWCEQGGNFGAAFSSWTSKTVTFSVPFRDTYYSVWAMTGHTSNTDSPCINAKNLTTFSCYPYNSTGNANWAAAGYTSKASVGNAQFTYLYFYVGDYSVSAIEQTAGITSEELNGKLDSDKIQFVTALPSTLDENVIYLISDIT